MKLPTGRGTWPAFWMLPSTNRYGNWPASGEIDIMEHVGYAPNVVHITTHMGAYYGSTAKTSSKPIPTATSAYHLYRVDWTPAYIRGYIDNLLVYEYANPKTSVAFWPFDIPNYLILNVAVGGNWGGAQGIDDTVFPAALYVDYVRVYEMNPRTLDPIADSL
jgi:beta-glucanase (GH16 family)